ncbi:GCN5-like N-acetyltransferase, partial [Usnea florida]
SIETKRLHLREARKSDLADFHELLSNSEVMRYWAWPTHTSFGQTTSYLNKMIAASTNGDIEFVIVLPAPKPFDPSATAAGKDKVIGTAGIFDKATGEIELMLHHDYWSQGYMSEVLASLIPRFWQRGVKVLVADVDPRNYGSVKLLNRFGFVETHRETKTCETDIGWCDSIYLELWRPR